MAILYAEIQCHKNDTSFDQKQGMPGLNTPEHFVKVLVSLFKAMKCVVRMLEHGFGMHKMFPILLHPSTTYMC